MRKLYWPLMVLLLFASSCDDLLNKEETNPDKTMGKEGNYWTGSVQGVGTATLTIDENTDGNVSAVIQYNGNTYPIEGKITDKGIYDYVYSNGDTKKPFTLVKFDASVGDKWEFNVGSNKVVREVVHKSTTDDTPYVFWMVKTIDVEETIPTGTMINGKPTNIKKILWKFNHKFGFIAAEITTTDNKTVAVSGGATNAAD